MCYKYKCDACKQGKYIYCKECLKNFEGGRRWCEVKVECPWGVELKRCHSCKTIVGAITELKALVLREPWLATEGVSGAPEKAAWEMENEEKGGDESEEDATPDGWTNEEREKIRREADEAVMHRWGLMVAEQAAENESQVGRLKTASTVCERWLDGLTAHVLFLVLCQWHC